MNASTHIRVTPLEGFRIFVTFSDVAHQFAAQIGGGGEYAWCDDVAVDLVKPQFNLIQPGRVRRSEVHLNVLVLGQKCVDAFRFMRRQIVGNDVDFSTFGLMRHDLRKKGNKFFAGVSLGSLADNFARFGI